MEMEERRKDGRGVMGSNKKIMGVKESQKGEREH